MKAYIKLILSGTFLTMSCSERSQETECPAPPITRQFMSVMNLVGDDPATFIAGSMQEVTDLFVIPLLHKAPDSTVRLGDPLNTYLSDEKLWLTKSQVHSKIFRSDTMYVESAKPPYKLTMRVERDTVGADRFLSIRAFEQWHVDGSLRLRREVKAYVPVVSNIDPLNGSVRGKEPLFYVEQDPRSAEPMKLATVRYRQPVKSSDPQQWYRENLEASVREKLFTPLMRKAWDGTLQVYTSPDAQQAMSLEELKKRLCRMDTMYFESPEPPYALEEYVFETCDDRFSDQIVAMDFVQDVYLNEHMALSYDVKWYSLVANVGKQGEGEADGSTEVFFWVRN